VNEVVDSLPLGEGLARSSMYGLPEREMRNGAGTQRRCRGEAAGRHTLAMPECGIFGGESALSPEAAAPSSAVCSRALAYGSGRCRRRRSGVLPFPRSLRALQTQPSVRNVRALFRAAQFANADVKVCSVKKEKKEKRNRKCCSATCTRAGRPRNGRANPVIGPT
jgi:hypothetical protein